MSKRADLLQVYYPHLEDTVEVLQVQRVLERMNTFLRLMHDGLSVPKGEHRRVDVSHEMIAGRRHVEAIRGQLRSAFPIPEWALLGDLQALAMDPGRVQAVLDRFEKLAAVEYPGLSIDWETRSRSGALLGTARLPTGRIQPFVLLLKSEGERLVIRCVSPVGRVNPEATVAAVEESARSRQVRLGVILGTDDAQYDLTVEDDVILGDAAHDLSRVGVLLKRVLEQSDILEQVHLPSLDQPFAVFESDLRREGESDHA